MITITVQCEDWDEVRILSNAVQYHHLMQDFANAMRNARKHGTEEDQLNLIEQFMPDFFTALENHQGAY